MAIIVEQLDQDYRTYRIFRYWTSRNMLDSQIDMILRAYNMDHTNVFIRLIP